MRKKPNFANYIISKRDIGKNEIEVHNFKVKLPYIVKKRDIGKRVAVNLNGRV